MLQHSNIKGIVGPHTSSQQVIFPSMSAYMSVQRFNIRRMVGPPVEVVFLILTSYSAHMGDSVS